MTQGPLDAYTPTMPARDVERIRRWHEEAYRATLEESATPRLFGYLGTTLRIPPTVMPITSMSYLLGEAVRDEVRKGDAVLDMGTGCGVNAILAARRGAHVVAVDVNPEALDATRANAERNGVGDAIDVRRSDVFETVPEVFDLIVFDPPYRWFAPRDALEAATTDEDYRATRRFFREARDHLRPGGRMLVSFATSGDLEYLRRLVDAAGFAVGTVATARLEREDVTVEYLVFRLT